MADQKQKDLKTNTDWLSGVRDWFTFITSPATDEETKAKQEDDWVAQELIGIGEIEEVSPPEAIDKAVKHADPVENANKKREHFVSENTKTMHESKDEWIARDMMNAGKEDAKDWVADDMKKAGKFGSSQQQLSTEWIAQEMKNAGNAGTVQRRTKEDTKRKKSKNELIAKDMQKAGKITGEDWVARDMEKAGKPLDEDTKNLSWIKKLGKTLDKTREEKYDDIFDDMEKAGKEGAHSTDWVAQDMMRAGMAEAPMSGITSVGNDASYKLGDWEKKAFDVNKIRKEMEEAGHADSSDWVARDLEETGRNPSTTRQSYPAPKKEITGWLSKEKDEWIAIDMTKEGKGSSSRRTDNKLTGQQLEDIVAEDMKQAGQASNSWIARDMQRAGQADARLNKGPTAFVSHQKRETEEFMNARKVKIAPAAAVDLAEAVEPAEAVELSSLVQIAMEDMPYKNDSKEIFVNDDTLQEPLSMDILSLGHHLHDPAKEHYGVKNVMKRAAKKMLMPWRKWSDL